MGSLEVKNKIEMKQYIKRKVEPTVVYDPVQSAITHRTENRLQERLLLDSMYKKEFKHEIRYFETNLLNPMKFDLTKIQVQMKRTVNEFFNFKINMISRLYFIRSSCYLVHDPRS